jgi:hypothetical protein
MLHDPEVYPDPMEFKPERFNGDDAAMNAAKELPFGFGRRVCPGIHLAEGTLFAIIATLLATCDILPGLNEDGKEVLPEYAYTNGTLMYVESVFVLLAVKLICFFVNLLSFPEPFSLRLRARSSQAVALLAEASAVPPE